MKNEISSIQIRNSVKNALDRYKERNNESYEEIIVRMINLLEKQKRKRRELLIEGCKEMAEESLKITKEFEATEDLDSWEW